MEAKYHEKLMNVRLADSVIRLGLVYDGSGGPDQFDNFLTKWELNEKTMRLTQTQSLLLLRMVQRQAAYELIAQMPVTGDSKDGLTQLNEHLRRRSGRSEHDTFDCIDSDMFARCLERFMQNV